MLKEKIILYCDIYHILIYTIRIFKSFMILDLTDGSKKNTLY